MDGARGRFEDEGCWDVRGRRESWTGKNVDVDRAGDGGDGQEVEKRVCSGDGARY